MSERQPLRRVFGQSGRTDQRGMTVLEMLVAMLMLVVFTGVVAMVMEFTFRFLGAAESGERNEFEVSNGVLIDHHQLQLAMDQRFPPLWRALCTGGVGGNVLGYTLFYVGHLPERWLSPGAADSKPWHSHVLWHLATSSASNRGVPTTCSCRPASPSPSSPRCLP